MKLKWVINQHEKDTIYWRDDLIEGVPKETERYTESELIERGVVGWYEEVSDEH